MRTSKSMAMLLRTPVKSMVTFLLIAAVTFGLFSQICEYSVTSREMASLAAFYRITGTVESSHVPEHAIGSADALTTQIFDKTKHMKYFDMNTEEGRDAFDAFTRQYGALPQSAIDGILKSPHVLATSTRYMGAGISDTYYRIDGNEYFYNYSSRLVGEGIVKPKAAVFLESVGINPAQMKRYPSHLSGGEQQRVAIARSLASGARILIADEPTGNLDVENSQIIVEILAGLARKDGYCVIVVTHDMDVSKSADAVLRMVDGALCVEQ